MDKGDNPYEILGVEKNATTSEIKKKYRKLALEHHPDRQETEEDKAKSSHVFARMSAAYDLLSDDETRKTYDDKQIAKKEKKESPSRSKTPTPPTTRGTKKASAAGGTGPGPKPQKGPVKKTATPIKPSSSSSPAPVATGWTRAAPKQVGKPTAGPAAGASVARPSAKTAVQPRNRASIELKKTDSKKAPPGRTLSAPQNKLVVHQPSKKAPARSSSGSVSVGGGTTKQQQQQPARPVSGSASVGGGTNHNNTNNSSKVGGGSDAKVVEMKTSSKTVTRSNGTIEVIETTILIKSDGTTERLVKSTFKGGTPDGTTAGNGSGSKSPPPLKKKASIISKKDSTTSHTNKSKSSSGSSGAASDWDTDSGGGEDEKKKKKSLFGGLFGSKKKKDKEEKASN
jgi:curved DNA-binding protein CbpA